MCLDAYAAGPEFRSKCNTHPGIHFIRCLPAQAFAKAQIDLRNHPVYSGNCQLAEVTETAAGTKQNYAQVNALRNLCWLFGQAAASRGGEKRTTDNQHRRDFPLG